MIIGKIAMPIAFGIFFNSIFDFFYRLGEPGKVGSGSVHLLCYIGIRGEIPHLHPLSLDPTQPNPYQSQLVNNPGYLSWKVTWIIDWG